MPLKLDSIAIDCPNAAELSGFYGQLLDLPVEFDAVRLPDRDLEIWFQEVDDYLPPTWPTQERGQQAHLDLGVNDVAAGVARAESLGATRAKFQPGDSWTVMLDPAGHPFCLFTEETEAANDLPHIAHISIDAGDKNALAGFIQQLLGGEFQDYGSFGVLESDTPIGLGFQTVEGYQPTTWPTQERGQQLHVDYHTDNRDAEVARATSLGAVVQVVQRTFTVLKDPAGHTFCICDA